MAYTLFTWSKCGHHQEKFILYNQSITRFSMLSFSNHAIMYLIEHRSFEGSKATVQTQRTRGATGYGLSADIRIRIRLQSGYGYHFFTSVNIRIRIRIRKVGADTDMVKVISYSYPIRYPNVACFIMISVWRRLFFNRIRY